MQAILDLFDDEIDSNKILRRQKHKTFRENKTSFSLGRLDRRQNKTTQNEETTWRSESTFALIIDIGGCAVVSFLDRGDGNRSSQNIWMDCRWADRIVHEPSAYYDVWKPSRATNEIPWSIVLLLLLLRPLCHLPHLPGILRLAFERGMLVRLPPGKSPGGIPTKIRLGGRKLRRRRQAQNQNQSQRVHRQFPARVHVQLLRGNPGFRGMHERETQILRRSIMGNYGGLEP